MPTTTRYFGLLLIVLGVASYVLTGRTSITALIPAFFGVVLVICALVARNESVRKHAMHAAVAVGLLGALASLGRGIPAALSGGASRPAVLSQLIMGVLLLIYVALGVQSFIAARKARMGQVTPSEVTTDTFLAVPPAAALPEKGSADRSWLSQSRALSFASG